MIWYRRYLSEMNSSCVHFSTHSDKKTDIKRAKHLSNKSRIGFDNSIKDDRVPLSSSFYIVSV